MIRLLQIEWIKLKNSRSFKILITIWLLAFLSVPIALDSFISWLETTGLEGSELLSIKPSDFPIFDFEDIWQNMAYLYKNIKGRGSRISTAKYPELFNLSGIEHSLVREAKTVQCLLKHLLKLMYFQMF